MTIRSNTDSLVNMVNGVLASLYHVASTDEAPNHDLCPSGQDTWCRYNQDPSTIKHKYELPKAIFELLEPIHEELSHFQLLIQMSSWQNPKSQRMPPTN